jgi:hypothetical protein
MYNNKSLHWIGLCENSLEALCWDVGNPLGAVGDALVWKVAFDLVPILVVIE